MSRPRVSRRVTLARAASTHATNSRTSASWGGRSGDSYDTSLEASVERAEVYPDGSLGPFALLGVSLNVARDRLPQKGRSRTVWSAYPIWAGPRSRKQRVSGISHSFPQATIPL